MARRLELGRVVVRIAVDAAEAPAVRVGDGMLTEYNGVRDMHLPGRVAVIGLVAVPMCQEVATLPAHMSTHTPTAHTCLHTYLHTCLHI